MRKLYFLGVLSILLGSINMAAQTVKRLTVHQRIAISISSTIRITKVKTSLMAAPGGRVPLFPVVIDPGGGGGGGGGGCSAVWVLDADGDGHYAGGPVGQCEAPAPGWVLQTSQQSGDCDDNDPTVWQSSTFYIDGDMDGYDAGLQTVCYGFTIPGGFSFTTNGPDCNDADPGMHSLVLYYLDLDRDGYGSTLAVPLCYSTPPAGFSTNNTDCDDNDASVWQTGTFYIDRDGDGYDAGQQTVCYGATIPAGYSQTTNGSDCDDTNPNIHTQFRFLPDADGDGYGDGDSKGVLVCAVDENTPPAGYTTKEKIDCDDSDPNSWQSALLYVDQDGDGYDNGQQTVCYGATIPARYSQTTNGSDCDDANPTIHAQFGFLPDADGDGYGDGDSKGVLVCAVDENTPPAGYTTKEKIDCDDSDPNVWQSALLYVDQDQDGYDNGQQTVCYGATPPAHYSLTSKGSDCNDIDPLIHTVVLYYIDNDHDGYGSTTTAILCLSSPPVGYSTNNTDCNDGDASIHNSQLYYLDADKDGYGNPGKTISVCSSTPPAGYVKDNTDCNDNNGNIHAGQTFYLDADKDGFGNPAKSTVVCSSTAPFGYVSNNGDCNDNDPGIHAPKMYYVDADHDGYGSKTTAMVCSSKPPSGYTTNNNDCDDNNAAVYPGAVEICGNAKDDNCNGQVDEGCTVCRNATGLTTTNITTSAAKLNWTASGNPLGWEVDYKKSSASSWTKLLLLGTARSITISSLSSNQTYNWRIRALCGKDWTGFSSTMSFKTLSSNNVVSQSYAQPLAEEESSSAGLKLYPNPNNGQFVIELSMPNEPDGNAKIQMIDVLGRIVHTENGNVSGGKLLKTITMPSQLTRGIYMTRIIVNDRAYQTKLIYQ